MTEHQDHLILKYLQGALSGNDLEIFETWMNRSDENRKMVNDFRKVWELSDIPDDETDFGTAQEWTRLQHALRLDSEKTPVVALNTRSYALRAAAAIAFLMVSSFLIYTLVLQNNEIVYESADQTLHVTLPDGSEVWLNQNSRISYQPDFSESRDVDIDGEGFFEVKPDNEHPFAVHAGEVRVKVLGTSFNVKAYDKELLTEVFVVTGKVSFSGDDGKGIVLMPGLTGKFNKKDHTMISEAEEDLNVMAWRNKKLIFRQAPLRDVIRTLKNYFSTEIQIKNKDLMDCRFTSEFNDPTLQEVIETLGIALDLQVSHQNNVYTLDGEGCNAQ